MRSHFMRGAAVLAAACLALAAANAADEKKAEKTEKTAKKPPSVCVGLDLKACGTKAECYWKEQITTKAGKTRKAHCRLKSRQQLAKTAT